VSAAAPWSVKGIEPKAREIAKDLARRSGMTLGEWLNTMIMEDGGDDEGVVPLSRRPHAADSYERRSRSRRVDDAYGGGEEPWQRLGVSIDAIAARLEAAESRSTVAIQGVDQAVNGLVRRLESQDEAGRAHSRRIDDIAEDLREGHRRLRKFEQEVAPKTTETLGKVEATLGTLAGRLYDIEERQRGSVNELRQRMDAVEKVAGPGAGADLLAQVGQRLDQAQNRTTEALRGLERSFAGLDQRLRAAEGRVEPEGVREAARFEKLAETLSRQVEANRAEMMRRMDTAENEGRMDRIERALLAVGDQVKASEERSAKAVEAMGREVLRIAQNLNGRLGSIEADAPVRLEQFGEALTRKVEADMGRFAQGLEQRLVAADDRHALGLEKLGGEITRISDRLSERIALSERRSQQALEDIGRRLVDSSTRIEQRYDRASGELAERMRLSEERTAALIAESQESLGRRAAPAPAPAEPAEPDWRAAAFPDAAFPEAPFAEGFDDPVFAEQQAWSADLAPPEPEPPARVDSPVLTADTVFDAVMRGPAADAAPSAPFGSRAPEPLAAEEIRPAPQAATPNPAPAPTPSPAPASAQAPFGHGFGGADVSDALAATAPSSFDAGQDDFAGETDFVDPRALRAAAAQGRASSTRQTIDAARAAMATPEEPTPRSGFGLKRGGKSRLQERLDKQASRGGDTVRKALGASAVAVLLTAGGAVAFGELTGAGLNIPGLDGSGGDNEAQPIAALAATAVDATPLDPERGADLYRQAVERLDADDASGVEVLKQAAGLGHPPAQLHLAGLYQEGGKGLPVDAGEARAWAKRAADSGDARGMHAYGMYLFDGVGGAQDPAGALSWLREAAESGLVDSQFNVAKLYETGDEGIQPNLAEAYKWYLIAARAGDTDAKAAAERLKADLPAPARGTAQAAADAFQVEPLA
jgi:localization factor PodJL